MRFTLMNKHDPVLDFEYDETQHAVLRVYSAHDLSRAPLAIWNDRVAKFASWDTLASLVGRWWKRRGIPDSRIGLKQSKRLAGFRDSMQLTATTRAFIESGIYAVSKIADAEPIDTNDMDAIQQRSHTIDRLRAHHLATTGHPTVFKV